MTLKVPNQSRRGVKNVNVSTRFPTTAFAPRAVVLNDHGTTQGEGMGRKTRGFSCECAVLYGACVIARWGRDADSL